MATTPFSLEGLSDGNRSKSLQHIPRYLFRVSDDQLPGTTSLTQVSSPGFDETLEPGEDLFQMGSKWAAAHELNKHLWKKCDSTCNLVSWTSCLLFALQHTLYRHKTTDWYKPLSEIQILVVDTHQFEKGTFARESEAIEAFRRMPTMRLPGKMLPELTLSGLQKLRHLNRYYFGEYLSQGKLTIDSSRASLVTMQDLIDAGLFTICPQLGIESFWDQLSRRVTTLRKELSPVEVSHTQTLMDVAAVFGTFEIPVALMLLSLSPADLEDAYPHYIQVLLDGYSRDELRGIKADFFSAPTNLPEIRRCHELARMLVERVEESATPEDTPTKTNMDEAASPGFREAEQNFVDVLRRLTSRLEDASDAMAELADKTRGMQRTYSKISDNYLGQLYSESCLYRLHHPDPLL